MLVRLMVVVSASPGERPPGESEETEGDWAWLAVVGDVGETADGGGDVPWPERPGARIVGVVGESGDVGVDALRSDPLSDTERGMAAAPGPLAALVSC